MSSCVSSLPLSTLRTTFLDTTMTQQLQVYVRKAEYKQQCHRQNTLKNMDQKGEIKPMTHASVFFSKKINLCFLGWSKGIPLDIQSLASRHSGTNRTKHNMESLSQETEENSSAVPFTARSVSTACWSQGRRSCRQLHVLSSQRLGD